MASRPTPRGGLACAAAAAGPEVAIAGLGPASATAWLGWLGWLGGWRGWGGWGGWPAAELAAAAGGVPGAWACGVAGCEGPGTILGVASWCPDLLS